MFTYFLLILFLLILFEFMHLLRLEEQVESTLILGIPLLLFLDDVMVHILSSRWLSRGHLILIHYLINLLL